MKRQIFFYLCTLVFSTTSCIPLVSLIPEAKMASFSIKNTGKSTYENVVVFAKDRNGDIVDSSYSQGYFPNTPGVSVGIEISKISNIESGLFEIQAKIENGKLIIHEFGSINKPLKEKEYKIELRDSTVVVL